MMTNVYIASGQNFWTVANSVHSKNQIVVLANNLVTVVAWLSFPC